MLQSITSQVEYHDDGEIDSLVLQAGAELQRNAKLMVAVSSGRVSSVQNLIDWGANVNMVGFEGRTPLIQAAAQGHVTLASTLLAYKADAHATDIKGVSSLAVACANGHSEFVSLLSQEGVNVDATTDTGITPLVLAIANGFGDTARTLIEAKSDINTAGHDGITPLMAAALRGLGPICTMLVELNADIDAEFGNDNSTALTLAEHYGHHHIVALFEATQVRIRAVTKRREKRKSRRRRRCAAKLNVLECTEATCAVETPHCEDPPQPLFDRDEDDISCVVCMDDDREVTHMLYPCGHLCLCSVCVRHFSGGQCPKCRATVVHSMKVFRT